MLSNIVQITDLKSLVGMAYSEGVEAHLIVEKDCGTRFNVLLGISKGKATIQRSLSNLPFTTNDFLGMVKAAKEAAE